MSDAAPRRRRAVFAEMGLVIAILAVIGLIAVLGRGDEFIDPYNRDRLLRQIGLLGIFAVGVCVVIIGGGIDLSVGSIIGLSGMLVAILLRAVAAGLPDGADFGGPQLVGALGAMVGLGVLVGLFHAVLICRLHLPPFIATLSTLAGLRSAAQLITNSAPVPVPQKSFCALGQGLNPLWFFLVVAVGVAVMMGRGRLGRGIFAIGGNEEAARLSGLPVDRLKTVSYALSGGLAGLAGVLYAAFIGQGAPNTGNAYELQAIAACVVGGCSLSGGVGSVLGVVLGVVLLQVTLNGIGLVVKGNSTLWQGIVVGVVVVLAVALNVQRQRRAQRAEARR